MSDFILVMTFNCHLRKLHLRLLMSNSFVPMHFLCCRHYHLCELTIKLQITDFCLDKKTLKIS